MIDGRDVTHEPPRRRGLGMVFQNYSLFPHMTVRENIAYGLKVQRAPAAQIARRVADMLDLIRLPQVAERRPTELSGGQQQRVALARALATNPSLLMLDEPLGALDLKLRHQLQTELRRIHRETGVTFLFVTHDQGEALFLSDRIAVMRGGSIEQIDTPMQIYQHPVNDYVADFIGDVTLLPCRADPAQGTAVVIDGGARIPLTRLPQQATEVFRLVVRPEHVQAAPAGAQGIPATVEDVINEGSTTLLQLRIGAATTLKARFIGQKRSAAVRGERLDVTIDPDVVSLKASAA